VFLTAQLVRTADGHEGINAFAFLHGNIALPVGRDGAPDVAYVAEFEPGRCVLEDAEIPPGGNVVLAYIDVAARDDTPDSQVKRVLDSLRRDEATPDCMFADAPNAEGVSRAAAWYRPMIRRDEKSAVVLRFSILGQSVAPLKYTDVFSRLRVRIMELIRSRAQMGRHPPGPYVLWLRALPGGMELSLPAATRARLPRSAARIGRLLLPADLLVHFPGEVRAALVEGALALLGRDRKRVRTEGGMRFVDPESGRELFKADVASSRVAEGQPPAHRPAKPRRHRNPPR